jgi:hypothetical protein
MKAEVANNLFNEKSSATNRACRVPVLAFFARACLEPVEGVGAMLADSMIVAPLR